MRNVLLSLLLGPVLTILASTQSQTSSTAQTQTPAGPKPDAGRGCGQSGGRHPAMDAFYKLGPDSMPHEGVPRGKFEGPKVIQSEVFPGTQHTYWVYQNVRLADALTKNIQRPPFNIQPSTAAAVGRWTLNVGR